MNETLYVPVAKVAAHLGLDPAALTEVQKEILTDAILDAQGKVAEYLNRPLEPRSETLTGLWRDERYAHSEVRAWPEAVARLDNRLAVTTYAPNSEYAATWDVTFAVGLDVENDPELDPIRRFIRQDAVAGLDGHAAFPGLERRVKSVSAEGQSLTFEGRGASPDAAGGTLTVGTLRRWRRYAVGRAPAPRDSRPWPYRA
jgi:hypothetical protein